MKIIFIRNQQNLHFIFVQNEFWIDFLGIDQAERQGYFLSEGLEGVAEKN